MTDLPSWGTRALDAAAREERVRDVVAAIDKELAPSTVVKDFPGDARRVDRMVRAVRKLSSETPGRATGTEVKHVVGWARRQWPARQAKAFSRAWELAEEASRQGAPEDTDATAGAVGPGGAEPTQVAMEAYLRWLLEVRQRCRAQASEDARRVQRDRV